MMIAIAAITAKAANRLPLTPKRGRKNLPIPNRNAMPNAPSRYQKTNAVAVSRYPVKKIGIFERSVQCLSNK
jgi:hypothetical protein